MRKYRWSDRRERKWIEAFLQNITSASRAEINLVTGAVLEAPIDARSIRPVAVSTGAVYEPEPHSNLFHVVVLGMGIIAVRYTFRVFAFDVSDLPDLDEGVEV